MNEDTGGTRRPGFRGVRNNDTTAARAARSRKALERKIQAAEALLIEHGAEIIWPTNR